MFTRPIASLALVATTCLVGAAQGETDPPAGRAATALIRVRAIPPAVLPSQKEVSEEQYRRYVQTQARMIRSFFVLQAALRDPAAEEILVLKEAHAMRWLREALRVEVIDNSEMMQISVHDEELSDQQLEAICNAVVSAYLSEAVHNDRLIAQMSRDLLDESHDRVREKIQDRSEEYQALAIELGTADSPRAEVEKTLLIKRVDLINLEILRLENRLLEELLQLKLLQVSLHPEAAGDPSDAESAAAQSPQLDAAKSKYETMLNVLGMRVATLKKRREELVRQIRELSTPSVELIRRRKEIEALEQLAKSMALKLETNEIEISAPDRVQIFQRATVGPLDE